MMLIYYLLNLFIGLISLKIILKRKYIINNIFFSVHIIFFFFLVVVGSFYVYFPEFSPYENSNFFSTTYFLVLITHQLILLFFCIYLVNKKNSREKGLINLHSIRLKKRYYYIPLVLCVLLVGNYLLRNGLPVFYKLINSSLSSKEIVIQRTLFFSEQANFFINEIGFFIAPTLMTIYSFTKNVLFPSKRNLFLFLLHLLVAILLSLSFFHKTPLLILLLTIIISHIILNKPLLTFRKVLIYGFLLFSIILIQYYVVLQNQEIVSISHILNSIVNRIFGVYPLGLAVAIKLSFETGYLYGATMPNFLGVFNPDGINLSQLIHYEIFGFEGNAPSPALGYTYINWGIIGVILDTVFISLFLILINQFLNKLNNSYIKFLIYCIAIPQIMFLSMSSVFDSLLNPRDYVVLGSLIIVLMLRLKNNTCE